jgi:hypothetical protein
MGILQRILAWLRLRREQRQMDVHLDPRLAPNQKPAGTYSEEEIIDGRAREFGRSMKLSVQRGRAQARYRDLEEKMGIRPGIDGMRVNLKNKPY